MSRAHTALVAFALSGALISFHAAAAPGNETPEHLLAQLEADAAHKGALAAPLEKARAALSRARAMDHSGDQAHAALMRAVAREWLDVARDLVRAVEIEAKATQKEKSLDELETKITRGQALLEETVARRARAQALLEQVERAEPAAPTAPTAPKGKDKPASPEPAAPAVPPRPGPLQLTPPSVAPAAPGRPAPAPPAPAKTPPGAAPSAAPKTAPAVENPKPPAPAAPPRESK